MALLIDGSRRDEIRLVIDCNCGCFVSFVGLGVGDEFGDFESHCNPDYGIINQFLSEVFLLQDDMLVRNKPMRG